MEIPELFDVIDMYLISKWRKREEAEDDGFLSRNINEHKNNLLATLMKDEQKEILNHLELCIENNMDELFYRVGKKLFCFGFNAGIAMQKAIDEVT